MLSQIIEFLANLSANLGPVGTFLGMFLAASVLPIPSEIVLFGVGMLSSNPIEIAVYGAFGMSLGAIVAYYIGRVLGRKAVEKIGKYFFITKKIEKVCDNWFKKYGKSTVFIARAIPIIPHKVFSILAGVSNMEFKSFFIMTLLGTAIRSFFLVYFGNWVNKLNNWWIVLASMIVLFILPLLFSKIVERLNY